jgi:DNA gyrase/topoisomerase IV subunit B
MYLIAGTSAFRAVLNALSERLVVSATPSGHRYRVIFAKGTIVSPLGRTRASRYTQELPTTMGLAHD